MGYATKISPSLVDGRKLLNWGHIDCDVWKRFDALLFFLLEFDGLFDEMTAVVVTLDGLNNLGMILEHARGSQQAAMDPVEEVTFGSLEFLQLFGVLLFDAFGIPVIRETTWK